VLAVGIIGAVIARFKPDGMARTLFVTALAQALVGVIALAAGFGSTAPSFPEAIVLLSGFFSALWFLSAYLFRKAAREQTSAGAAP
jgi:CHASE2 domain-containing sensor protein